jgi:putative redox protein
MADVTVALRWAGEAMRFHGGRVGGPEVAMDGDGVEGPSPMAALLLSLAGCMAADVVLIGGRMRLPMTGLEVVVDADRRAEPPRRYTAIRLKYIVAGVPAADEAKVRRAIDLSRETYCSVWHSLRDDIDITIDLEMR